MRVRFIFILLLIAAQTNLFAQSCPISSLGQNPSTAFPVCGTDTFHQETVPSCGNGALYVPGCQGDGVTYIDVNPYYYKFTCFQSGTLGFLITPNNLDDDYDWQLFDITGHSPDDIYINHSLAVTGNWSGNSSLESSRGYTGVTGTKLTGIDNFVCASNPPELGGNPPYTDRTTFCRMPVIIQGHNYLLMVSHYTSTNQSGYSLSFGGGTASITDPLDPLLKSATSDCGGTKLRIKLNKQMKCSSLKSNGSDFRISGGAAAVVSATGINCSSGFDMDSVVVSLNPSLPPGNYFLIAQNGSDGNTLLDNCDRNVPIDDSVPFTVLPLVPTPFDSITPVGCSPTTLQLVFKKGIQCSSIAPNGSDFLVKGISGFIGISVSGATDACADGVSTIINVQLANPISVADTYEIILKKGSDGNTLLDECGLETPPDTIFFKGYDTVSADFSYQLFKGCAVDSVAYTHDGANGVNKWYWIFDHNIIRTIQNPVIYYTSFGVKVSTLAVSNGVCTDTITKNILLDNYFNAAFEAPEFLCPSDQAIFKNNSVGHIIAWRWDFGNGNSSTDSAPPPQTYPVVPRDTYVTVRLIAQNDINCFDTAYQTIKVLYNCYIAVPTAFTPNGDGLNDYLYPLNAYKSSNLVFRVFNRWGQLLFETRDWTHKWDGTVDGHAQPSGTYVWTLTYTASDTGKPVSQKGTSVLIR